MTISPLAGQPAGAAQRIDVDRILAAYHDLTPDPTQVRQRVQFGTSGHRGAALERSFNDAHIAAITQAICRYRASAGITGPLFIGIDTHALSQPALATALEVLAAEGVEVIVSAGDAYTPTPVVSHAILAYNRGRSSGLADGIIVTPSHNPPDEGGFKYNPPHGGPAEQAITSSIERDANALLEAGLAGVKRLSSAQAWQSGRIHEQDVRGAYIDDLARIIDLERIRASGISIGVDPLGGAGVHYWPLIAERHRLPLTVVNRSVDPTFSFMTLDWDGRIRMDPSSPFAMHRLIALKDRFDIAFACDTDHDRHGIVCRSSGLLSANRYLAVMVSYLFRHRPHWPATLGIGKTVVSTMQIDRLAHQLQRPLFEVPVGFKWFVDGLVQGRLGFTGEESAGATFARLDGGAWTTDKDGIVAALLAAEMTATVRRDPGEIAADVSRMVGESYATRVDAPADRAQRSRLAALSPSHITSTTLAGDPIQAIQTTAPGNGAAIGGVKVVSAGGWFAARPSGTEDIYKIYAESSVSQAHMRTILAEAQRMVDTALGATAAGGSAPAG